MEINPDNLLSRNMAEQTQKRYVCAACWGHLAIFQVPDRTKLHVTCPECGDGKGFVTKGFADRAIANSKAEAAEVRKILTDAGILPKQSKDDILKSLGF